MRGFPLGVSKNRLLDELSAAELPFPPSISVDTQRVRVLHVDDDPNFGELVKTFLERTADSLSVVTEGNATDALSLLESEPIDCIVSDYEMPGMDGLELLKTIRAGAVSTPFILYTGKGSEEIASEAIAAGVTDYMQKETGVDHYEILANRIANVVDQYRTENELMTSLSAYRRLVEQNLVGIYAIRLDRIIFVNEMIANLLDYDRAEIIGRPLLEFIDEADHETVRENVEKRQSGEIESIEYTVAVKRKDGSRVQARVHGGGVEINGESAVLGVLLVD